jgi:hypothetical protein
LVKLPSLPERERFPWLLLPKAALNDPEDLTPRILISDIVKKPNQPNLVCEIRDLPFEDDG